MIGAPSDLAPSAEVALGFHVALEAKDFEAFADLWTPDAVNELPFHSPVSPPALDGREAIVADYRAMITKRKDLQFTIHSVIVDESAEHVVVEFSGRSIIGETGTVYKQDYIGVFTVEGTRLSRLRLYADPQRAAAALKAIR
ncbi:nuclear transport factor 2 family protein [Nocardioides sp. NPDC051685]|uniref:nuclear transport factor 2 family protein n=1 Tax=Nocardioides sp. NPDC051685 TaxID=3364334 RepID=UPI00378BF424